MSRDVFVVEHRLREDPGMWMIGNVCVTEREAKAVMAFLDASERYGKDRIERRVVRYVPNGSK